MSQKAHAPDYGLIVITLALLCIGIVMVYSASVVASYAEFGDQTYFFQRQLIWSAVGVVVMFGFMRVPYHWWRQVSLLALVVSVGLLVAVLVPGLGTTALGATRWIRIAGIPVGQPSELCKVTLAIYMAAWLAGKGERVREFSYGTLPFIAILGLIVALVMKQPDMGTALMIIGTAVIIFFVAGANLLQLLPIGAAGGLAMAFLALTSGYRQGRLTAFLDPWAHPEDSGYHVVQSLIALGAGGVRGLGLGDSRQKFGLLPFPYTDSIFAVIGEELGLVGCTVVLALFLALAYRGLRTAWRAPDMFGALLAIGISCQMAMQAFINIAVVTSTVPFTGITLPFVSYGGSSMVVSFAAMGILLNVTKYTQERAYEQNPAPAAERRRHWWTRVPHARRGAVSPRAALARG
uniref:Probable peptidoglycan glycosyltransferase FtsW n=1 Tax=uncultured bacterium 5E7 TaxID=1701324 RepID=A0A0N9HTN2_9BACT|nr:stage V sporulation protein E [uncultured bacterium 5E7]